MCLDCCPDDGISPACSDTLAHAMSCLTLPEAKPLIREYA